MAIWRKYAPRFLILTILFTLHDYANGDIYSNIK